MSLEQLTITRPTGVMRILDRVGHRLQMNQRHTAALIFPMRGSIRFRQNDQLFPCDARHPVFVPQGASYLNECLEEADSLMFCFDTLALPTDICVLRTIAADSVRARYERMELLAARQDAQSRALMMSELYALLSEVVSPPKISRAETLLEPALRLMAAQYCRSSLSCQELADAAHISPAYLRRLFLQQYQTTPFRYLTGLRMERARQLLLEGCSVKETALRVGYADIYQFSRARKKFETRKTSSASDPSNDIWQQTTKQVRQ